MPQIINDPALAACPSFESPEWDFLRQTMINAHPGPPPLTAEEATQRLRDAWARDNENRVATWNAQQNEIRAAEAERERLAREEEAAHQAQRDKEAENQRRETEKKKPKLNPFNPNQQVSSWIEPRPATYALNKINTLEYVELDYFTVRGCNEAAVDSNRSIGLDTLGFAQVDDAIAIRPLAAQKISKNIRNDEDLSWEEMLEAKNTMLHFMAQSGIWPIAHAESLAAFFVALELHPRRLQANGKTTLLLYQSRVRLEWFNALKRDEGFNIEIISEELLRSYAEIVSNAVRKREMDQVRVHHIPASGVITNRTLLAPSLLPPSPTLFAFDAAPAIGCSPIAAHHARSSTGCPIARYTRLWMSSTGCSHCLLNAALDVLNRLFPLPAECGAGCPQPAVPTAR